MTSPRRRPGLRAASVATAGVAACWLLAACGGSPAAPAATPATSAASATESSPASDVTAGGSACSLVTEQDATAALGSDPGAGQPVTSNGASQCQYGSVRTSLVLVNLTPSEGAAAYDHLRHDPKLASSGAAIDMPGLGDRAFGITGHGTGSIWISKGDSLALVMVAKPLSANATQDAVLALAKTVAGRL